jgi:hypothetical protein
VGKVPQGKEGGSEGREVVGAWQGVLPSPLRSAKLPPNGVLATGHSSRSGDGTTFKPEEGKHMAIQWTDVESSQILQIGYDPETLKARVLFKKKDGTPGATYEYDAVPEQVVTDIIEAGSAGQQFNATLKYWGGGYRKL